ncbi:MAG: hypothetical protein M2R46_05156 [Verrucomicrobia subdivision 3 bacterium]|nr:hypothetical protein [Limisphaerales bacterium]
MARRFVYLRGNQVEQTIKTVFGQAKRRDEMHLHLGGFRPIGVLQVFGCHGLRIENVGLDDSG